MMVFLISATIGAGITLGIFCALVLFLIVVTGVDEWLMLRK